MVLPRYATYLSAFPGPGEDSFDHPLFWNDVELDMLLRSSARASEPLVSSADEQDGDVKAVALSDAPVIFSGKKRRL
jgi:hypothetical protein